MPLDPQAQDLLDRAIRSNTPAYETLSPEEARILYDRASEKLQGAPPALFKTEELQIQQSGVVLQAKLYRPTDAANLPALVYFHGGGFVFGSLQSHDAACATLCKEANCLVIAVDYRLAPEYPYPTAVDDAWLALNWVAANATALGIDATRIAVGGDSAGGTLAAILALKARDEKGVKLIYQLLVYPLVDMSCNYPSHKNFGQGYRLTNELLDWFLLHYFAASGDSDHWTASPIKAANFSGLPPACIISAGYDPLQDENYAYAEKLRQAGVDVHHTHYETMLHGFFSMPGVLDKSREAISECAALLRLAFTQQ